MLLLVDERRAGQDGLAAADVVAVLLVQVQRGDGQVALHVRLLVDRELDLAVLDGLRRVGVEVEGDELGLAAGRVHRLERVEGDRRAEGDDLVDRLVLRPAWPGGPRRPTESSAPLTWMFSVFGKPSFTPAQRASSATEPAAWITQRIFRPVGGDPLAGRLTGEVLVGAEVHQRADLLVLVDAGVEGDDRDAGVDGRLDRAGERVRGGQRGGDAVDLGVDRVLDQRGLLGRVRVVGVLQRDAVVLGGLLRAGLDLVPERVARGSRG